MVVQQQLILIKLSEQLLSPKSDEKGQNLKLFCF